MTGLLITNFMKMVHATVFLITNFKKMVHMIGFLITNFMEMVPMHDDYAFVSSLNNKPRFDVKFPLRW